MVYWYGLSRGAVINLKGLYLYFTIFSIQQFMIRYTYYHFLIFVLFILIAGIKTSAQNSSAMYRIAKIKVDSSQLEKYKSALQEQMNGAIKLEPGVLSYTAVADKKDATSITILEVYANTQAYQSHLLTSHFKKYKETVKDMVLSLELIDTDLVFRASKLDY